MSETPVRVRIAPSPTGDPHVGTAYIALFNYVFARKHGGRFILRIEDTDRARSTADSEAAILRALRWIGLEWDEGPDVGGPFGPYRQSERSAVYREHALMLVERGTAYPCFCTPQRLEEMKAAQRGQSFIGYDRRCRGLAPEEARRRMALGEPHTIRLAMPVDGITEVDDLLRGRVEFHNATIDDQVLLKSDGFPTYHLANVVDDHAMQISHVIRAEEWISSTPKHLQLYHAFGWQPPCWIHMPLLRNQDKTKISKRKNPVSLDYYRDVGYLPEALLNFLGNLGFAFGGDREKFTLEEMIAAFDWSKVSTTGPVFDLKKLDWLNGLYIRDLSPEQLLERLRAWRLADAFLLQVIPLLRERMERFDQFVPAAEFFFAGDLDVSRCAGEMVPKGRTPAEAATALAGLLDVLDGLRPWDRTALDPACRSHGERIGWKTKELFMSVRVAVTGRTASPGLFETLEVLGKELTRRRLRLAVEALKQART